MIQQGKLVDRTKLESAPKLSLLDLPRKQAVSQSPSYSGAHLWFMGRCHASKPKIYPRNRVDGGWA